MVPSISGLLKQFCFWRKHEPLPVGWVREARGVRQSGSGRGQDEKGGSLADAPPLLPLPLHPLPSSALTVVRSIYRQLHQGPSAPGLPGFSANGGHLQEMEGAGPSHGWPQRSLSSGDPVPPSTPQSQRW